MFLGFIIIYVKWFDSFCEIIVREVYGGECLLFGFVYLVLGNKYLKVECSGVDYCLIFDDGFKVLGYKFFVDVMFDLLVEYVGVNVVGVLFIGMGWDGVKGFKSMYIKGFVMFC